MKAKNIVCIMVLLAVIFLPCFAMAGNIVIKGSTTVLPIAQKVAEAYMQQKPDVKISISGGGSGNGIKALIDGSTDIADSSRFIAVAYDCIIPVVHPSNTVTGLSTAQLKAIYKGEIKNWKDVGGPDSKIVVISRDTSSGTYEVWETKIMEKERVFPGALLQASNGAVVQAVSKNKNAVGYIGLGYVDNSVKGLTVNGVEGSPETTLNGMFPVSRALYMFTNGWPELDTLNFINFVLNPEKGQKYIEEAGFVPLY